MPSLCACSKMNSFSLLGYMYKASWAMIRVGSQAQNKAQEALSKTQNNRPKSPKSLNTLKLDLTCEKISPTELQSFSRIIL